MTRHLDDGEIERYSRQLLLPGFGERDQLRLIRARAVVVGLGGLGGPAALHLAGAGLGHIRLVDADCVALDNLHRQVAFRTADIGRAKVDAIAQSLQALNPAVAVEPYRQSVEARSIDGLLAGADVVVECTDRPDTKFLVNDWCVRHELPVVLGGAIGWHGQVTVVAPNGPCYRCLFKGPSPELVRSCRETGVIGPLVGVIGSLQALEVIRVLLWPGRSGGRLLDLEGESGRIRTVTMARDAGCPAHRA